MHVFLLNPICLHLQAPQCVAPAPDSPRAPGLTAGHRQPRWYWAHPLLQPRPHGQRHTDQESHS